MRRLLYITILALLPAAGRAQMVDGVRTGLYTKYDINTRKAMDAQAVAISAMTFHHKKLTEQEVDIADLQREFNKYLMQMHDQLVIAAQLYGTFYEFSQLAKHLKEIAEIVQECPENVLANAFKDDKRQVVTAIVTSTTDLIFDIKKTIVDKTRMSGRERVQTLDGMRRKVKDINRNLKKIERNIRYYNLFDLWNDIRNREYLKRKKTNVEIAIEARDEWQNHFKPILSTNP